MGPGVGFMLEAQSCNILHFFSLFLFLHMIYPLSMITVHTKPSNIHGSLFFYTSSHIEQRRPQHPLQCSHLENPMDGGVWWAAAHGVAKNQTRLSDFTFTFHFHALEKEMATHSSALAWKIPWEEEPGRLQPMGSRRIRHD